MRRPLSSRQDQLWSWKVQAGERGRGRAAQMWGLPGLSPTPLSIAPINHRVPSSKREPRQRLQASLQVRIRQFPHVYKNPANMIRGFGRHTVGKLKFKWGGKKHKEE